MTIFCFRSDSPLSDRNFDKCSSSLLSLNRGSAIRLADSDGAFDYKQQGQQLGGGCGSSVGSGRSTMSLRSAAGSPRHSDAAPGTSETTRRKKLRRRRKKTPSPKGSSEAVAAASANTSISPKESTTNLSVFESPEDLVCSPRRSLMKRRLRSHQEEAEHRGELNTSSSNESIHSSRYSAKNY